MSTVRVYYNAPTGLIHVDGPAKILEAVTKACVIDEKAKGWKSFKFDPHPGKENQYFLPGVHGIQASANGTKFSMVMLCDALKGAGCKMSHMSLVNAMGYCELQYWDVASS
jgi:hypothetical protein